MVNTNKIKAKIVECGKTIGVLAKGVGLSPYTLGQQIRNKSDMRVSTITFLVDELLIPAAEIPNYFFASEVAKRN
jgi:hypothetical protein